MPPINTTDGDNEWPSIEFNLGEKNSHRTYDVNVPVSHRTKPEEQEESAREIEKENRNEKEDKICINGNTPNLV